jgi:DNA primase
MAMIPHHKIEEILARTDVVATVGRFVSLKKSGRDFKACCPFHNEKTPSFYVNPQKHSWYCFGCSMGGDSINFLMRIQARSFIEVVRDLAKDTGVDLGGAEDPTQVEKSALRLVNELAQAHWRAHLLDPAIGKAARDHLSARGVTEESWAKFGIGFAMDSWDDLTTRLTREGQLDVAQRATLISQRTSPAPGAPAGAKPGFYDFFRGRIVIPIRSPEGRVIGFGARQMHKEQVPKYLNSRENLLFSKSEVLYAMDLAREPIRRSGVAVLVEGYFDAIGLHQAGIANAVALCSTTVTPKQLDLLKKYGAKELVLLLDGDAAGIKAVERLAAPIVAAGAMAKVVELPAGMDPDDFVVKQGSEAMAQLIATAPPLTEYLLARALPEGDKATVEKKLAALTTLRPVIEAVPAGLERSLLLKRLEQYLGVPEAELKRSFTFLPPPKPEPEPVPVPDKKAPLANLVPVSEAELLLCALLLADPSLGKAPGADAAGQVRHTGLRQILEAHLKGEDIVDLWDGLELPIAKRLQLRQYELTVKWKEGNRPQALKDTAQEIRLAGIEDRLKQIAVEFKKSGATDLMGEDTRSLLEEQQRLRELRTQLTRPPEDVEAQGSSAH